MRWVIRTSKILGGTLAYSALALSGTFLYRVSADALGVGAMMLAMPKVIVGALAPYIAVAGAAGGALALLAAILERGKQSRPAQRHGFRRAAGTALSASSIALAGFAASIMMAGYVHAVTRQSTGFEETFGTGWQARISPDLRRSMLAERWTWKMPSSPDPRVQFDLVYATVPGTDRKLLADVWQPPEGVTPTGLAFIYMHGGGYVAFDKGAPNGPWFRHLASQGHVVMDIAYRLIPETNVMGMQGDVKRAISWMKRNADRYHVNPDRLVLGGESAGSHLALLAAYAPHDPLFTPEDLRDKDLSVRGVVGYYSSGDNRVKSKPSISGGRVERAVGGLLIGMLESFSNSKIPSDDEWSARFLGGQPEEWPELYRQVSPITHVGPDTPPTLQFMGEHDVYVAGGGTIPELHGRLQESGVPSVYVELPRTDHAFDKFFPDLSPAARTAMYDVDRFLALMASPQ